MHAPQSATPQRSGVIAAITAFVVWGLFPLYLALLVPAGSLEIVSQRVSWCFALLMVWTGLSRQWPALKAALTHGPTLAALSLSAVLIAFNWLLYVWAANNGHVLDCSLGYFINPLINVLIGVVFLKERLNRWQWVAVSCAGAGVLWLSLQLGHPPWVALGLAVSFAIYGLVRKRVVVDAITGLTVETLLALPFALGWLFFIAQSGELAFGHHGWHLDLWLALGGLITATPLVLFGYAVRRVPLTTVGLLQYLAPTLQFFCGVLIFHEPFSAAKGVGFALIWLALGIYATDGVLRSRRSAEVEV